ncbi:MAG: hypothetical protein ACRD11_07510 [Terriglobia bacterium]
MSRPAPFEIACPCCGSKLTIDPRLGKVLLATPPEKAPAERDLDHAAQLLARDAERRDSLFQKSVADEKSKADLLERKFAEALKRSQRDPSAPPPVRDIDLD